MASMFVKMTRCFGNRVDRTRSRVDHCPNVAKPELEPVLRSDMDNLSLGVEVGVGKMYVLIPSNNKILKKKEKLFTSCVDNQSDAYVGVYEGESSLVTENVLLGEFFLDGIPPTPKDIEKFKVCFDIDANGTLTVSAEDLISSESKKEITITSEQRRSAKIRKAKNTLEKYAEDILKTVSDTRYAGKLKAEEKRKIINVANESIRWLYMNQSAKIYEYKDEQKHLEDLWNPIITKLYVDAALPKVENKSASLEPESCSVTPKTASQKHEYRTVTPKSAFNLNDVD